MYSLESQFDELLAKLKEPGFLNPAQSDPVYYFVYPPEKILEVKKAIPRWSAKFGLAGFQVKRISLPRFFGGRWISRVGGRNGLSLKNMPIKKTLMNRSGCFA